VESMARAVIAAPTGVAKVVSIMNMVNTATTLGPACGAKAVRPVRRGLTCRRKCAR
jgi:hypothetical protein